MKIDVSKVWVDETNIYIQTKAGRVKYLPISDFKLLRNATPEQRQNFEFDSFGIRWEELDEDLSIEGFFSKEELVIVKQLEPITQYVSISYIATRFFGKSRAWLHNKLNGTSPMGNRRN